MPDQCNHTFAFLSEPFFEQVAEVARALLFWLECLGVARDSIVLKTPTPSIDAEGVGPVEMATHNVQSIRLQLAQPTHGPYVRTALECKRHLQASSLSAHT